MKQQWFFSLFKVILLYCCGIVVGAEIILLGTGDVGPVVGGLEIVLMAIVSGYLVVSSRRTEETTQS